MARLAPGSGESFGAAGQGYSHRANASRRVARHAGVISCGTPMQILSSKPVAGHFYGDHHGRVPMCSVEHPEESTS